MGKHQGDLRAAPSAFILVVLASLLILLWDDPEGSWKRQWTLTDSVVVERMGVFFGKLLPIVKASHIQSIVSDSLKPPGLYHARLLCPSLEMEIVMPISPGCHEDKIRSCL